MTYFDLFIGPLYFILILAIGFVLRPIICDKNTRGYFIPALTLKIIGAITVGLIYQFYYGGGGDTFTYFTHGAAHIWQAFLDSPSTAGQLIFTENDYQGGVWDYARRIWVYRDSPSYVVVRFAGFFSIITLGTYVGTAILFAIFSFSGTWAMYQGFYQMYPSASKYLAYAILFIPSAVFWGSGILKDTLTLGALGWSTWAVIQLLELKRRYVISIIVLVLSLLLVYSIKKYIVLCFIPSILIWVYFRYLSRARSVILQAMVAPLVLGIMLLVGYLAIDQIGKGDPRYALDRLGETAMITAMDIGYWTGKGAGSKYSLGEPDPSLFGMVRKAPAAINVSLFRPYLWEVTNPLMLISAFESLVFLLATIYIIFTVGFQNLKIGLQDPIVVFCLVFSLTFAFAVGISTYNFGTLVRYKIPLLPFYLTGVMLIRHNIASERF